ncbi:MAG: outer membrane protein assembly factor BamA [Bacteroidetes bacterium]|nr:outer membrane protein assembly factor BamA [Bacteroidota bacterium]
MTKKITFIFLLIFSCFSLRAQVMVGGDSLSFDYANPKPYQVGGITVTGTQFLDESVLINLSGLVRDDTIEVPGEKISKAVENLWKQGLFSDVKIVANKIQGKLIFLELKLQERPRLSKFSFKGVSKSEADKIREKIKLERDKVVTENVLVTTKNAVKDFYTEKGYMNAEVQVKEIRDSAYINREILNILVDKKQKIKVHDIIFEGNAEFKNGKLKHAMKETKESRWYKIFTSSKFIDDLYQQDKSKIIAKFNDKGYRDAKIESDSVYKYTENRVNIKIKINPGHKYFFRNVNWVGNTKHSSQELGNILNIKKGDTYDQSVLDNRLYMNQNGRDVTSLYMDDGYLFFQINPVEVNVENDSIDLEMRIYEGKQAVINKVTVTGNTKTNDRVIMREIRTKPGQLFSRSDIIRTQRELAQLGYFDQEKLGVNPKPNPADGTVDIEYVVEEKPSDQLELSGGYGANQLVGTLGLSFNNFSARNLFRKNAWKPLPSGDGQRLSLRFQTNGKAYQSYNASFTEPWLGGKKPNSFSVSAFRSRFVPNGRNDGDPLQQSAKITGFTIGLGKRLKKPDDFFTLYHELSYQYFDLKNYGSFFVFPSGTANVLSLGETIGRNSIDAPIFPRRGSQVSLSVQFTPPYSLFNHTDYKTANDREKYRLIEFHKWKFQSTWFTELARNLVLSAKIQYGFLGLYNRDIGIAPLERFYLGGDGLTGGYQFDGRELIGLRGYTNNSLTPYNGAGVQVGGTIFDKYALEIRYPLSLNPSATIYLLTFAEGGNSWLKFKDFNPFGVKRSAGFGIRIFLPMFGLLGLDWGYGFDKLYNDPSGRNSGSQIHFSIGQQF